MTSPGICIDAAEIIFRDTRPLARLRVHLNTCPYCNRTTAAELLGTVAFSPKQLRRNPLAALFAQTLVAQALSV